MRGASIDRREDSLAAGSAGADCGIKMEDGGIPGSQAGYETSNAEKCEGARKV